MARGNLFLYVGILLVASLMLSFIWSFSVVMNQRCPSPYNYKEKRRGKVQNLSKNTKKFLYMTFDDGPNFGTHVVLDAFKAAGGKGTFFINCLRICTCETNLLPEYYEKGNCTSNQAALLRMVNEGHTLGDHSSDHMAHNHVGHGFHYVNGRRDFPYFGEANISPIAAFLRDQKVDEELVRRAEMTMAAVKRLPFTDIWRVPGVRAPSSDGRARKVAGAIAKAGGNVYGWDLHWGLHWNVRTRKETREVVGVKSMLAQLRAGRGRQHGKLVFLSHDYVHLRPDTSNPKLTPKMKSGSKDLEMFIAGAMRKNWTIRTLDTYPTD